LHLLDRHIFKSVLFTCLAAVGLFSFVFALANFVRDLLPPLLAGQLGVGMLIRLVLLLFPYTIIYALPAGILTGVLLTLGRLSADSEVTAMRAAGIGVVRVARPVFILGVLGTAAALYSNFESMPWSRVQYHREFADAVRASPLSFLVPKTYIRDFKGFVVYVGDRPAGSQLLRDVWVWELDNQARAKRMFRAETGRVEFDEASNSVVATLLHVMVQENIAENPEDMMTKAPRVSSYDQLQQVKLPFASTLGQDIFHVKPEWLRYGQLEKRRAELALQPVEPGKEKEAAVARMKLAMIVHDKANLSLAVFAFAFIAVPLGIKVSRRETSANLGIAVMLVLGYYILSAAVKSLDRHPEYRPDLLLWAPNVIFLGLGTWLIRRVEK
jgi:lipopolysaccharide export system permease protein